MLAPFIPQQDKICFWGGWGGSLVLVDLQRRMTLAYVMNRMASGIIGGPNIARLMDCGCVIVGR